MSFNPNLSLYIPRIANNCFMKQSGLSFNNMTEFIGHMFHSLDLGRVSRVDLVPIYSKSGAASNFSKAFVHFDTWYDTASAQSIQEKMRCASSGGIAKLVYDDPHYWILKPNKSINTNVNGTGYSAQLALLQEQVVNLTSQLQQYQQKLSENTYNEYSLQPHSPKRRRKSPLSAN